MTISASGFSAFAADQPNETRFEVIAESFAL